MRLAGYPEPVAHTLAGLCTTAAPVDMVAAAPAVGPAQVERRRRLLHRLAAPHLTQGAPTSPALANLSAFGLDRRLAGPDLVGRRRQPHPRDEAGAGLRRHRVANMRREV